MDEVIGIIGGIAFFVAAGCLQSAWRGILYESYDEDTSAILARVGFAATIIAGLCLIWFV